MSHALSAAFLLYMSTLLVPMVLPRPAAIAIITVLFLPLSDGGSVAEAWREHSRSLGEMLEMEDGDVLDAGR